MKALNLSIYTGDDEKGHKVTMTAEFANHEEAVRFHEGIAKLCRDSGSDERSWSGATKLLPKLAGR